MKIRHQGPGKIPTPERPGHPARPQLRKPTEPLPALFVRGDKEWLVFVHLQVATNRFLFCTDAANSSIGEWLPRRAVQFISKRRMREIEYARKKVRANESSS